jgi:hypothetical protein
MAHNRLLKIQTVAVQILFIASFALGQQQAAAQAPATPATPAAPAAPAAPGWPIIAANNSCSETISRITRAKGLADAACGNDSNCIRQAMMCHDTDQTLGERSLESNESDDEDCLDMEMACPVLSDASRRELNEARTSTARERRDAQKERSEATQRMLDNQKNFQEQADKIDEDMIKLRRDFRDNQRKATEELQQQLQGLDNEKLRAIKDAQKQYDQWDQEYINMRRDLRAMSSDVNNRELAWKVACRRDAERIGQQAQTEIDARQKAEAATYMNQQGRSLTGYQRRRLKTKRKTIVDRYNEFLTKCLKAEVDPGAAAKIEIDALRNKYVNAQQEAADKAARIENLRQQMMKDLQTLEEMLEKRRADLVKNVREQMQNMQQDFAENMARQQQRVGRMQQQQMQQQMMDMQKMQQADQDLQRLSRAQTMASNRLKCMRSGAGSGNISPRKVEEVARAREALYSAAADCTGLRAACMGHPPESLAPTFALCDNGIANLVALYRNAGQSNSEAGVRARGGGSTR